MNDPPSKACRRPNSTSRGGVRLSLGERDGAIHHVSTVPNGLACGCKCPACGEKLVAKHPAKIQQHFAHVSGAECARAVETAIHLYAKQLLSESRRIRVPDLSGDAQAFNGEVVREIAYLSKMLTFDRVALEVVRAGFTPDAICTTSGHDLLVEFRNTHAVDHVKMQRLSDAMTRSIEVDIRQAQLITDKEELDTYILDLAPRKWLSHPRLFDLDRAARIRAEARDEEIKRANEARRREVEERQREAEAQRVAQDAKGARDAMAALDQIVLRTVSGAPSITGQPRPDELALVDKYGLLPLTSLPLPHSWALRRSQHEFETAILYQYVARPLELGKSVSFLSDVEVARFAMAQSFFIDIYADVRSPVHMHATRLLPVPKSATHYVHDYFRALASVGGCTLMLDGSVPWSVNLTYSSLRKAAAILEALPLGHQEWGDQGSWWAERGLSLAGWVNILPVVGRYQIIGVVARIESAVAEGHFGAASVGFEGLANEFRKHGVRHPALIDTLSELQKLAWREKSEDEPDAEQLQARYSPG